MRQCPARVFSIFATVPVSPSLSKNSHLQSPFPTLIARVPVPFRFYGSDTGTPEKKCLMQVQKTPGVLIKENHLSGNQAVPLDTV